LNVNQPARVVITITGSSQINLNSVGFVGAFQKTIGIHTRIIWVLCDVPTLTLSSATIPGSVLALTTALTGG